MPNPDHLPEPPVGYLWLSRIKTHGVRYIGNHNLPMGTILEVKGSNNTGKSLFLKQVRRGFKKEHDPELIDDGYDEAVVELEFIDQTEPSPVTFNVKTITTPKKTYREVGASDGRVIDKQVETWLGKLTDAFLMDPLALLDANRAIREEHLRLILPVRFTGTELTAITGIPATDCDMKQFDAILAGAETERTRLNKDKEQIEGSINRLAKGLIEAIETVDYTAEEDVRRKELAELETLRRDQKQKIEINRRKDIADLEGELARTIEDLRKQYALKYESVNSEAREATAVCDQGWQQQITDKSNEVGEAKAKASAQQQQRGLRQQLDKERAALRTAARAATAAQDVVDNLRNLQSAKWSTLPIKDLTYHGGDLFLRGKNIHEGKVNTAEVYKVLCLITQHSIRPGMLPLIITDRTESLDDNNRKWFYDAFREAGFQLIVEDVHRSEMPLTLEVLV